jgi:hypothetical protein
VSSNLKRNKVKVWPSRWSRLPVVKGVPSLAWTLTDSHRFLHQICPSSSHSYLVDRPDQSPIQNLFARYRAHHQAGKAKEARQAYSRGEDRLQNEPLSTEVRPVYMFGMYSKPEQQHPGAEEWKLALGHLSLDSRAAETKRLIAEI